MKMIGNIIISDEVWDTKFSCDLSKCKGKCCQYGDIGSPITEEEEIRIKDNLKNIKTMLSNENINLLNKGITTKDSRGDLHIVEGAHNTPCPLSFINKDGIVLCSLHDYCLKSKQKVLDLKPLWCSLFPLIIKSTPVGWIINCYIPDFCKSIDNPPPLLLSFADYLSEIFGEKWVETVREEYRREGKER
jgi:Fe-S-cluster containining protein